MSIFLPDGNAHARSEPLWPSDPCEQELFAEEAMDHQSRTVLAASELCAPWDKKEMQKVESVHLPFFMPSSADANKKDNEKLKNAIRAVLNEWPSEREITYVGVYRKLDKSSRAGVSSVEKIKPLIAEVAKASGRKLTSERLHTIAKTRKAVSEKIRTMVRENPDVRAREILETLPAATRPSLRTIQVMKQAICGPDEKKRSPPKGPGAALSPLQKQKIEEALRQWFVDGKFYLTLKEIRSLLVEKNLLPKSTSARAYEESLMSIVRRVRGITGEDVRKIRLERSAENKETP